MRSVENKTAFDKWSIGHVLIGMIIGLLNTYIIIAIALFVIWESFEIWLEKRPMTWLTKSHETNINRLADIFCDLVGWVIGIMILSIIIIL